MHSPPGRRPVDTGSGQRARKGPDVGLVGASVASMTTRACSVGLVRTRSLRLLFWSMSTMPLSEVKARLSEIADEVDRTHERVHVTRNGREYVVLLSAEDLESLEATIELLRDDAGMSRVRDADAAVAAGDLTTGEDMAALMSERRAREHRER